VRTALLPTDIALNVLVTGGSGFIGSHVLDRLSAHGHVPRNFDLVQSPYHDGGIETVIGDLLDVDAVRGAVRGRDAIVHLAAVADVNDVVADPARAELVNDRGTGVLLEAARAEGISRVLYASTVWVYGDANGSGPVDEDSYLPLPRHLYTATKLAGEMYCTSYAELWGIEHTILRFGIPYGPRARPATVVAAFVERACAGKPLTITGDGTQSRRFVYVEDLADGVVAALTPNAAGRIYNLVGDESVTIREIAETVRELVADVPIVHVEDRPGDLRPAEISGARAAQELGWRPVTPFAEGVRRYVDWVTATHGTPRVATASRIVGRAAAVLRQEPEEL
jgi:UDP-glucose 4-epimerase